MTTGKSAGTASGKFASAKILVVGLGSTGNYVLDMATKMEAFRDCAFTVVSRTPAETAEKRLNITRVSSGLFDLFPEIGYRRGDVNDVDGMAELIRRLDPDIVAYTGRYMKGLKYGEYSYPNNIGYGVWLPLAVVLPEKLMQAVKAAGSRARVINTSYGDGVSPALASVGLAPYVSAGNLNHLIPRIKRAAANLAGGGKRPEQVEVRLAGSHFLNTYVSKEGDPRGSAYRLDWNVDGEKPAGITDAALFAACGVPTISGPERNWMIASDVVRLMELMLAQDGREYAIHAPGPFGLIGGYPLLFRNGEMRLDETAFSRDEMIRVNEDSLRRDGVDGIDAAGLHFTDEARERMREVFGFDYPRTVTVADCEPFAEELARMIENHKKK